MPTVGTVTVLKQRQLKFNSPTPTPVRTPFVNGSKGIFSHPVHWDAVVVAGKSHGQGSRQISAELKFKSRNDRDTRDTRLCGVRCPGKKILVFFTLQCSVLK